MSHRLDAEVADVSRAVNGRTTAVKAEGLAITGADRAGFAGKGIEQAELHRR